MIRALEDRVLAWLRVPEAPSPPAGSPGSLKVFRAGRNYLTLRLFVWGGAQLGAVFGIVLSLTFIREMELQIELERLRTERAAAEAAAAPEHETATAAEEPGMPAATSPAEAAPAPPDPAEAGPVPERGRFHRVAYELAPPWLRELPRRLPAWTLVWIRRLEMLAIAGFVAQLIGSGFLLRLEYQVRWYMVTDRSLRLRWGLFGVHESTMSFANLQQVTVRQGPLQRLLGLADVEVQSAGGGSGSKELEDKESMHRNVFHAVDNAPEIRDLILDRLRHFRQAGLGDPDDSHPRRDPGPAGAGGAPVLDAAKAVLDEVRAWRQSLAGSGGHDRGAGTSAPEDQVVPPRGLEPRTN